MASGCVSFVGAGPGVPGLLTVRAAELLARADAVVRDVAVPEALLDGCPEGCARALASGDAWADGDALVARARAGEAVVRLAAGDAVWLCPAGEGMRVELAAVEAAGVALEIVPGILTATVAASHAGFVFDGASMLPARADAASAPVLFEGDADAIGAEVARMLGDARPLDPAAPAAVVAHAGTARQRVRVGVLSDVATRARALAPAGTPLLLVLGDGVEARRASWFERLPLFGKRVLVTRGREQGVATAELLRAKGAEPVFAPTLEFVPPPDPAAIARAVREVAAYVWVVFTSANGVVWTFRELDAQGRDARAFGNVQIACIGPGTAAALAGRGLRSDLVARDAVGESLASELLDRLGERAPGARVLVLRAKEAREVLPDALRAAGAEVDVVAAYETRPVAAEAGATLAAALAARSLDVVTFTSASTVDGLVAMLGPRAAELLRGLPLASIGPVTSRALARHGLRPAVEAPEHTLPSLVEELAKIDFSPAGRRSS